MTGDSTPELAKWLVHIYLTMCHTLLTQGQATVHFGIIVSYERMQLN